MEELIGYDNIMLTVDFKEIEKTLKEKGMQGYALVQVLSHGIIGNKFLLFMTRKAELELVQTCKHCIYFEDASNYCRLHNYSTREEDTCLDWSDTEELSVVDNE